MTYRAYQGGWCLHCGHDLGLIETTGGRIRQYCNAACRQAARRARRAAAGVAAKRDAALSRYAPLRSRWAAAGYTSRTLGLLDLLLVDHGAAAARLGEDLVRQVAAEQVLPGREV